ncbi:MAG: hypothetical protein AAGI14_05755 [Pseudomonadota bacterium]
MTDTSTQPQGDRPLELAFEQLHRDSRFNRLFTLAALILSIAAIFVSLMEVSAMRTQQKATVWPSVSMQQRYNSEGFRLILTNKGVGPALIGDIKLFLGLSEIDDVDQAILETLGEERAFSYENYSMVNPSSGVVAPGETVDLFAVSWDERTRALINDWAPRINVTTCYCSIHGDCFATSLRSIQPTRTESCNGAQVP